jgi:hypothetical protein
MVLATRQLICEVRINHYSLRTPNVALLANASAADTGIAGLCLRTVRTITMHRKVSWKIRQEDTLTDPFIT